MRGWSMLAARCPQCGAPTPVSAAAPDLLDCAYCSYVGPPPPEVAASLRAAAAVLGSMQARRRQLTSFQHRTLGRMGCSMALYFALLGALALPFAIFAAACTAFRDEIETWVLLIVGFGPLIVVLVSGAFGWWWMRRSRAALEHACAATPPPVRGRPARCRVCGGDLAPPPGSIVARCQFCGTDNVVSQAAMQRRWSDEQLVLGGYEQAVQARAAAAGSASVLAKVMVFLAAVGAPTIVSVVALLVVIGLALHETPPDTTQQYVAVSTPGGECLAVVQHYPGGVQAYDFEDDVPPGVLKRARFPAGKFKPIGVKQLVGMKVLGSAGLVRSVKRVYRTSLDDQDNRVELSSGLSGTVSTQSVVGTCLPSGNPVERALVYTDRGIPEFAARLDGTLLLGFSSALYNVHGEHNMQQLWRSESGDAARSMLGDNEAVYLELYRHVLRITPDGKKLVLADLGVHIGRGLALDGHTLYFAGDHVVARVATTGGKVEPVLSGTVAQALAASDGAIALIDPRGDVFARAAGADTLGTLGHKAHADSGLAISDNQVWWVSSDGTLTSAPITGGSLKQYSKLESIDGLFKLRDGQVWWTRRWSRTSTVLSRPLGGGALVNHSPGARSIEAFGFDGADLYWMDSRRHWLMRRRL